MCSLICIAVQMQSQISKVTTPLWYKVGHNNSSLNKQNHSAQTYTPSSPAVFV
jgi:hypothetical protein